MSKPFCIGPDLITDQNRALSKDLDADYDHLGVQLARRHIDLESVTARVQQFAVAIPSWGVGTGGTRFARFPGLGEPRNVYEKVADCGVIQQLCRATPMISLHIPWDEPKDPAELRAAAASAGLRFDAMNSNTFQDHRGQRHSYKFGSLSHADAAVRAQAVEHNQQVIELGKQLGSKSITVWVADGANFPGQQNHRTALERYLDSLRAIYQSLPADWHLYLEHKLFEPAFYATVNNDWGTSYWCATQLGPKCQCLVDLGHHGPNTNIELIVARLSQFGKLGGFHFNDSKYGDDDLDSGSINPFQLFLVFHELLDAAARDPAFAPAYMLDQSHNVTDPIESLMNSAGEVQRALAQALLVDRERLALCQQHNDVLGAHRLLKQAFTCDVAPILAMARARAGGAIDPIATFRASGYRAAKAKERPAALNTGSGIV
jgi:L-rhamnose isomerase/sugar isomerase